MNSYKPPTILIIFGITGDLSRRKLLPALEKILDAGVTPEKFNVIGLTRQSTTVEDLLANTPYTKLRNHLELRQMDMTQSDDYLQLRTYLQEVKASFGEETQFLYYLSLPPQVSGPIVELLGRNGFAEGNSKLLLEKPFGTDLESAKELIEQTREHFSEQQLYRIDHYTAKEMAQNLIVFREGNSLLKKTWNNQFIEKIDIIATESIGIEGRSAFYEQTGALKDLVQSHLLQLTALTIMDSPSVGNESETPIRRLQALKQLYIPTDIPLSYTAKRAQYHGYLDEVQNPTSTVETYVDLTLHSSDPNWVGVPIRIITGKALHEKCTQIKVTYKKEQEYEANTLSINLQPHEGFEMQLWTKAPGFTWSVEKNSLKHSFAETHGPLPDAYEKVMVDAIASNHTLFTTSDEVLESWRILEPLRKNWELQNTPLPHYEKGSSAPLDL